MEIRVSFFTKSLFVESYLTKLSNNNEKFPFNITLSKRSNCTIRSRDNVKVNHVKVKSSNNKKAPIKYWSIIMIVKIVAHESLLSVWEVFSHLYFL